jgi:hypothetical protein
MVSSALCTWSVLVPGLWLNPHSRPSPSLPPCRNHTCSCACQAARQYYLSTQALEALSQLRGQFAAMLQDTHLVPHTGGSSSHGSSTGGASSSGPESWMDDPKHPCNRWAQGWCMQCLCHVAPCAAPGSTGHFCSWLLTPACALLQGCVLLAALHQLGLQPTSPHCTPTSITHTPTTAH